MAPPLSYGEATTLVSVRHLAKRYGGVIAIADMSLDVRRGTIHAVVGENGAGKSTLMKILAGVVRADGGEILIDGAPAEIGSPAAARRHGIGIVFQELSLFPERSVLANLYVNREPGRYGIVSVRAMEEGSRDILARLGLAVDVHAPIAGLSIGERQLVELVVAVAVQVRIAQAKQQRPAAEVLHVAGDVELGVVDHRPVVTRRRQRPRRRQLAPHRPHRVDRDGLVAARPDRVLDRERPRRRRRRQHHQPRRHPAAGRPARRSDQGHEDGAAWLTAERRLNLAMLSCAGRQRWFL